MDSPSTMAVSVIASSCPHRCYLSELSDAVYKENKHTFRLIGIVVKILAASDDNNAQHLPQTVLDDGTALVCIATPSNMLEAINVQVGKTLECIVNFDAQKECFAAHQLVWVTDVHAEPLRWAQMAYHCQHGHPEDDGDPSGGWGYPRHEITAEDVYDIIQSETHSNSEEDNELPRGFSLQEIAKLLDLATPVLVSMIEELQLSAKIYQNQYGCYLPL